MSSRERPLIRSEVIEAAARALFYIDEETQRKAYYEDPSSFPLGKPQSLNFEDWQEEYCKKAETALGAAIEVWVLED